MRTFFDTNILIYLFDEDALEKKTLAQKLFERESSAGRALLSTQVLQEFYVARSEDLFLRPLCRFAVISHSRHDRPRVRYGGRQGICRCTGVKDSKRWR